MRRAGLLLRFLGGWLTGGALQVGAPVGEKALAELRALLLSPGGRPQALELLRAAGAAELAPLPGPLPFEEEDLRIVVALYNLFALTHPDLSRVDVQPLAPGSAARWTLALVDGLGLPESRARAQARHGLVRRIFDCVRRDVEVRYWAGRLSYAGQPPPPRVLRWRRLRRVRVASVDRAIVEVAREDPASEILEALLRASPLTDLVSAGRETPPFHFGTSVRWLGDADLVRGIVRHWAAHSDPIHTGAALVQAALEHFQREADRVEILRLIHALYHLHVVINQEAILRGSPPPQPMGPGLTAAVPGDRWHFAFFKVVHRGREVFGLPGAQELGEALAERLAAYDAALKALDTRAEERALVEVLRRRLNLMGFPGRTRAEVVRGRPRTVDGSDGEGTEPDTEPGLPPADPR
ncbi:MAG: hypothetical protein D6729_19220 [Deltaproteobacteria bacterium]|nr:MAG: hypothetical protein D6729_19220 [Deltaproteobacteria bacterium]